MNTQPFETAATPVYPVFGLHIVCEWCGRAWSPEPGNALPDVLCCPNCLEDFQAQIAAPNFPDNAGEGEV